MKWLLLPQKIKNSKTFIYHLKANPLRFSKLVLFLKLHPDLGVIWGSKVVGKTCWVNLYIFTVFDIFLIYLGWKEKTFSGSTTDFIFKILAGNFISNPFLYFTGPCCGARLQKFVSGEPWQVSGSYFILIRRRLKKGQKWRKWGWKNAI